MASASFSKLLHELDEDSWLCSNLPVQEEVVSVSDSPQRELQRHDSTDEWLAELITTPQSNSSSSLQETQDEPACVLPVPGTLQDAQAEPDIHIAKRDLCGTKNMRNLEPSDLSCAQSVLNMEPLTGPSRPSPFIWCLPKANAAAGFILKHTLGAVDYLTSQPGKPTIFKVGVTKDPSHRWFNTRYGYAHDGTDWDRMVILAKADDMLAAGLIEAVLIKEFRSRAGCRNEAPGGEGLSPPGPYCVYVVYKHLHIAR